MLPSATVRKPNPKSPILSLVAAVDYYPESAIEIDDSGSRDMSPTAASPAAGEEVLPQMDAAAETGMETRSSSSHASQQSSSRSHSWRWIGLRERAERWERRTGDWGTRSHLLIRVHLQKSQPPAAGNLSPTVHRPTWQRSTMVRPV